MRCGGCGKRIWWWQGREHHNLKANPWRPAMRRVPFHPGCYANMNPLAR